MAQNYLKKQNMIKKYKTLEAKLEGVKIQIANIQTTDAMVNTMKNMAQIMGKSANSVDINNIQRTITEFNMNLEKQEAMGELVEDAMEMDQEEIEDQDADNLIDEIEGGLGGGGGQKQEVAQDDLADDLANLRI